MIMGPGRTPWISMAASSTAAGAEPGTARVSDRDHRPGHAGIVAGLGRHQPLDRALAELFALPARRAWPRHRRSRRRCPRPRPAMMPMNVPMTPGADDGAPVSQMSAMRRHYPVDAVTGRSDVGLRAHGARAPRRSRRRRPAPGSAPKPPTRSGMPKVKRAWAWMPSCPTIATSRPRKPASQPFSGSPPVRVARR